MIKDKKFGTAHIALTEESQNTMSSLAIALDDVEGAIPLKRDSSDKVLLPYSPIALLPFKKAVFTKPSRATHEVRDEHASTETSFRNYFFKCL